MSRNLIEIEKHTKNARCWALKPRQPKTITKFNRFFSKFNILKFLYNSDLFKTNLKMIFSLIFE